MLGFQMKGRLLHYTKQSFIQLGKQAMKHSDICDENDPLKVCDSGLLPIIKLLC
jgi:hypothetical protein